MRNIICWDYPDGYLEKNFPITPYQFCKKIFILAKKNYLLPQNIENYFWRYIKGRWKLYRRKSEADAFLKVGSNFSKKHIFPMFDYSKESSPIPPNTKVLGILGGIL